jgi:hypothetical protein
MLLGILTLITALCISAVAIYYSVAGLVAIFAAAAVPIMIMGGTLEIAKLVTAVWLHKYWKQAAWWLKSYLSVAVIVLMFITSMGIFGYLSKAHIEQTAESTDNLARIETIQSEIDRNLGAVGRAENRIRELETSETGNDDNTQSQIDKEQERIDSAYTRIQPAITEQNTIIANVTQLFQNELDKIDVELNTLQTYIDTDNIEKAQAMVGTKVDGNYGPKTAAAFTEWQQLKREERASWLTKIQDSANSATVQSARKEIARLRDNADKQIEQSNTLINRLREKLGNTDNTDAIQTAIDEQLERVRTASINVDSLTEEKITLESNYRKLEAEVGPIKYIAEFVYGEQATTNMLEEAVRWVIIIIIFVFDPLAVLLLIASQYTFEFNRRRKDDDGERLRLEREEYERARAQAIVDNPGFTLDDPIPPAVEDAVEPVPTQEEIPVPTQEEIPVPTQEDIPAPEEVVVPKTNIPNTKNRMFYPEEIETYEDDSVTEEQKKRKDYIDQQELKEDIKTLKQQWKTDNPDENLKMYKKLYIHGRIDSLPWIPEDNTYVQNGEQSNTSIWKNIRENK